MFILGGGHLIPLEKNNRIYNLMNWNLYYAVIVPTGTYTIGTNYNSSTYSGMLLLTLIITI